MIWEELLDFGVDISSGQVSRILTEQNEGFHLEKEGILCAGLDVSDYINVDDTGARHAGKNGYCTHILQCSSELIPLCSFNMIHLVMNNPI